MTIKKIIVHAYNPMWPILFTHEADFIKQALGANVLDIHHIGSTSVIGLAAKEDIDICLVVDHLSQSLALKDMGYTFKGELNIPLRYYFSKNSSVCKVNLHVVEANHHFIKLNLCFKNYLMNNQSALCDYQSLKQSLAADSANFERTKFRFPKYTLLKHDFINSILDLAGYQSMGVVSCTHDHEWNHYHRIMNAEIFAPLGIPYDCHHSSMHDPNHYHFVLLRGTTVVSAAHIKFLNHNTATIKAIATDHPYQNCTYESYLLEFLEKWVNHHSYSLDKNMYLKSLFCE